MKAGFGLVTMGGGAVGAYAKYGRTSFYSVQAADDVARLESGGSPWPSAPNRAQFGEGLYAWSTRKEAQTYFSTFNPEVVEKYSFSIVRFRINTFKFGMLSRRSVIAGSDDATRFFDKYSRIYGEGMEHGYDYLKLPTGNFQYQHFFDKKTFSLFKF